MSSRLADRKRAIGASCPDANDVATFAVVRTARVCQARISEAPLLGHAH